MQISMEEFWIKWVVVHEIMNAHNGRVWCRSHTSEEYVIQLWLICLLMIVNAWRNWEAVITHEMVVHAWQASEYLRWREADRRGRALMFIPFNLHSSIETEEVLLVFLRRRRSSFLFYLLRTRVFSSINHIKNGGIWVWSLHLFCCKASLCNSVSTSIISSAYKIKQQLKKKMIRII